jgi:hypothetical protein
MVVTKIRPSGDLAINRTRFNPSAADAIVKSAGSINENGRFPFKRTTCGVSFAPGADWEEQTDGIAAAHKIKGAATLTRNILFMSKIVPSNRRACRKNDRTNRSLNRRF